MKGPKLASVGAKKKNLGLSMKHDGAKKVGKTSKVGSLKNIEAGVKQLKKNTSGLSEVVSMSDGVTESLNGRKKKTKTKTSPQVKMGLKIDALIKQKVESGEMPSLPTSPSSPEVGKKKRNIKKPKSNEDKSNLESLSSPEVVKSRKKRRSKNKSKSPDAGKGVPTLQMEVPTEASVKKNKRPRKLSTSFDAKESEQPSTVSESSESPGAKKGKRRRVRRKSKSHRTVQESEKSPTPEGVTGMSRKRAGGKLQSEASPPKGSRKRAGGKLKSEASPPKKMSPIKLEPEPVLKAVTALLTHLNSKKSATLLNEPEPIFVQFGFNGVPITPKHLFRLKLKHSLVLDTTDVCLIVKDEKKEPDETVMYFTNLLSKHDLKVSEIIPMKTLKNEYSQFEEKRKLCERFDIFLCDSRINVVSFLGKKFQEKHKVPFSVELNENKVEDSINTALNKSLLMLNSTGSESSVQAGWHVMEKEEICDNIISLMDDVQSVIPAIIPLIQKVSIKSQKSPSFELFMSLCPPPSSKKILETTARSKPVVGELSTQADKDVIVFPSGEVKLKGVPGSSKRKRNRKRKSAKNVSELSSSDEGISPKKGELLAAPLNGIAKSSPSASNKMNSNSEVTSPKRKKVPKTKKVAELTPSKDSEGDDVDHLVWKKGAPSPNEKKLKKKMKPLAGEQNDKQVIVKKAKVNPSPKAKSPKKKQKASIKRVG